MYLRKKYTIRYFEPSLSSAITGLATLITIIYASVISDSIGFLLLNLNFKSLYIFLCIVAYIVLYVKNKKAILIECITRAFE